MKKSLFYAAVILLMAFTNGRSMPAAGFSPVPSKSENINIDLWTGNGEGAVYKEGEQVDVYFRPSQDCFVTLYDISTEGRTRIIFPKVGRRVCDTSARARASGRR